VLYDKKFKNTFFSSKIFYNKKFAIKANRA